MEQYHDAARAYSFAKADDPTELRAADNCQRVAVRATPADCFLIASTSCGRVMEAHFRPSSRITRCRSRFG
eukprot:CAMPEP_0198577276 /NCGR_PEP_ID=MMETSP1462-20131121/118698_1 /TAXON_ID=1333877 /ORGANISM="Brandtodinium nutriculum, Strain RCC3387" /LENGTH=70 /DNA_ID=CAMNT_0044308553 /DNA_START=266 /DNA_END=476 /DNA_ORIENTATION=-